MRPRRIRIMQKETNENPSQTTDQPSASKGKRHRCPKTGCGKSFSRPSHLARHALNHSNTQFSCPRCHACFKRLDLLERHKGRHVTKDRLAGGLGLGILQTKRRKRNLLVPFAHSSPRHQSSNPKSQMNIQWLLKGVTSPTEPGASDHPLTETSDPKPESEIASIEQICPQLVPGGKSTNIIEPDMIDLYELGNMYYDAAFDSTHFNIAGIASDDQHLSSMSTDPGGLSVPVPPLAPDSQEFSSVEWQQDQDHDGVSLSGLSQTDLPSKYQPFREQTLSEGSPIDMSLPSDSCDPDPIEMLRSLHLNKHQLPPLKRLEIITLINDARPVHPDGSLVSEMTADLSLGTLQEYLDLFMANFNTSYPLIHPATFDTADTEPILLLSMIILGATYKGKYDHQLSVCLYDALTPYIMSGLVSIQVPDLSMLQAFLILECYGMYRAGPYQRENAILIHTLLFNAIRRVSRYHVRARITLPDFLDTQYDDWKTFAFSEQYKRLILFVFMWDTQNVTYYSFMPSMSTQSIQVRLTCHKDLWETSDEAEWKRLAALYREPPTINEIVKDVFEDGGDLLSGTLDGLSLNFMLHGLMSMCNDMLHFNNRSIYLGDMEEGDVSWTPWRRRMAHALELWRTRYDAYAMEANQNIDDEVAQQNFRKENVAFLAHYHAAHIILNTDVRHLQIAAGAKALFGHIVTPAEQEDSTRTIKQWVRTSPSSVGHAAWHAVQMFREGLLNLKSWDVNGMFHYPWCLYIGALTCWAFHHFAKPSPKVPIEKPACDNARGHIAKMETESAALMNSTISQMASSSAADINKTAGRCCPHGLAFEIAKYLKTVRWTAAFEAMKVLQGLPTTV